MVGSIDPRCETIRGTHWPKPGRVVVGNSRRGSHLGQRFKPTAPTGRTYGCKRSGHTAKPLVPRGPSTYGSRRSQGRRERGTRVRDAFVPIHMSNSGRYTFAIPRRESARVLLLSPALLEKEGAGKAGCALHPRSRVQKG